jgi:tetratricopeptide (TPR) repeat protein
LTRAAIHLIETGASRPSSRTLAQIASRTGKPVTHFLVDPASTTTRRFGRINPAPDLTHRLAALQRMIGTENFAEALPAATQLLEESAGTESAADVQLCLARAQLETGNAVDALPHLRSARDLFVERRDSRKLAECVDWLGLALYRLEDADALAAFKDALRLCRGLRPVPRDQEARILGHIGACYTSTHHWQAAVEHYQDALAAAGNLRELSFLERMYNDIGLAEMQTGQLAAALDHFQKALGLARTRNEPRIIARLENNIGSVLVDVGELDAAESHLRRSLEICNNIGLEVGRGHVLCSLAELCLARHDDEAAEQYIQLALDLTRQLGESLTEADAHQLRGRSAEMRGDLRGADEAFKRALTVLAEQTAPDRLVECHAAYAEVLERRGDAVAALQHWKQALRITHPASYPRPHHSVIESRLA